MAPRKTVSLECCMERMAAMKKVLSPSSDTMMTEREAMKPWVKLTSRPPRAGAGAEAAPALAATWPVRRGQRSDEARGQARSEIRMGLCGE